MKWAELGIVVVGFVLAFAVGMYFEEIKSIEWGSLTGAAIVEESEESINVSRHYAWTTALCGYDRRCIDVTVECNGSQILNVTPVSNIVWHTEEWEDPRGGNPDQLCSN